MRAACAAAKAWRANWRGTALPPAVEILSAPATLQAWREGLKRLLAAASPDVVVCSTDTLTQGVLAEAASRRLDVPRDLAVIGFGDLSTTAHVYPSLSTVRVDGMTIGMKTTEALLARFAADSKSDAPKSKVSIDTGFTIIDRDSA
ncbi:substrate-binding domain-containing protein [Burkholderia ambifaria]|uniref:substrate-binding domain-containing protein n=1 Tax=Burkholderia ambifaria TaxID=152480 RepID=UPI00280C00CD|nr:substrate-binding domain-containing protein [Burkholderia ambifaria]